MPVFPLQTIEWIGNTVELKISDAAHQRIYHDLLLTGRRQLVAPLARMPLPGKSVDTDAPPEERQLHSMGSVLYLKELKEVSEETGGAVKYVAVHKVTARANIRRLLNPSAFFNSTDSSGANNTYLQAEVDVIEEPEMEVVQTSTAKQLIKALKELRSISESLDEPRLQSEALIKQSVFFMSTWQLIGLWQRLQLTVRSHREKVRVHAELWEWIKVQQRQGRLPQELPRQLDVSKLGVPWDLMKALAETQRSGNAQAGDDLWKPLLEMLAARGTEARRSILLQWVQGEVKLARARTSIRDLFA